MGIFDSARKKSEEVTKGNQAPRNLDPKNKVIQAAEERAASYSKILKGWERNLPLIEKRIKAIAKVPTYDYDSKVYHAKRQLRKFGGDERLAKKLIDKYL